MISHLIKYFPIFDFIALTGSAFIFLTPILDRRKILPSFLLITPVFILTGVICTIFNFSIGINTFLSFVVTIFAVIFCLEAKWKQVLFHCFWILIISSSFMTIYVLLSYLLGNRINLPLWGQVIALLLYIVLFNTAIGLTIARSLLDNHRYLVGPRQFSSALTLTVLFEFLNYFLQISYIDDLGLFTIVLLTFGQFYCVTILYLQNALFSKSVMQKELDKINYLFQHQKNQYKLSKENISLINSKCHDLKHQVSAIKAMTTEDERNNYLNQIEDSLNIYDSIINTGNEALDTILTEKSLYCQSHCIEISCVADGLKLNFMNSVDLYTIFGNALDNAIECVMKSDKSENRLIDVIIYKKNNMIIINIINPLIDALEYEEEFPRSSKPNNGYHGFGLKSIKHTVEKYKGFMTIDSSDNTFNLSMVIPLVQNR